MITAERKVMVGLSPINLALIPHDRILVPDLSMRVEGFDLWRRRRWRSDYTVPRTMRLGDRYTDSEVVLILLAHDQPDHKGLVPASNRRTRKNEKNKH